MKQASSGPVKRLIWKNIIFFVVTTFFGLVAAPLYIHAYGISASEIALFVFSCVVGNLLCELRQTHWASYDAY